MNILTKFIIPCRLVSLAQNSVFKSYNKPILSLKATFLRDNNRNMAQKTITSFFAARPPKANNVSVLTTKIKEEKADDHVDKSTDKSQSPISNGTEKRSSKRQRLESSDSEPDSTPNNTKKSSPTSSSEKKKITKRQRIESSSSESESPKPDVENTIKLEKTNSPKTYQSPKSKKTKASVLTEKKNGASKQTKIKKEQSDSEEDRKSKKSPRKETVAVKEETEVLEKVAESEYNPAKSKYHPIKDACWAKGEAVPYLALAKTLEAIEATSARLKMVEILANFLRSVIVLTPEDLLACIYMCLNQLAPAYHGVVLGIAETYLMKAIGQCTGRTVAQVRTAAHKCGDLGQVAEQARSTQRVMFAAPPLKANKVFTVLKEIAHMTGHASVNKKIGKIQSLYVACRHSEARYLIRSLEGKLRIGLAEQSVLQALALATAMTPPTPDGVHVLDASKGLPPDKFKSMVEENALTIKTTYCECPNYELMVPVLLSGGVSALPAACRLTPGIPLKPMLAHPTKGVHEVFDRFEGEQFTCEWKYDGERAQIHVPVGASDRPDLTNAAIFSRNQENNTTKYPDILRRLPTLLKDDVTSCVLDCEAVAYDIENKQILPFQILSTRKRKDANEADIKVQVCVFVFDLLYFNGTPLVREPLATRRELLRKHFNEVEGEWQFATSKDCTSMEDVAQFLEEAVKGSCEGLMVKTLLGENARYDIARRSHNWLKIKKDYLEGVGDTIDAVVIGGYRGKGKRAGAYGGFLLACHDPDSEEYQSLCKIGTGFSDEDLQTFTNMLDEHVIEAPRNYYRFDASHSADVWFSAACVWEVRCADLSLSPSHHAAIGLVDPDKGISLRFPRFIRVREDKSPEQATSAQQIAELYLSQDQVINQTNKQTKHDDFY